MGESSRQKYNVNPPPPIQPIDLTKINEAAFLHCCVGCIVLSQDGKIVLQQRDADSPTYPGCLATFGGGLEPGGKPHASFGTRAERGVRRASSRVRRYQSWCYYRKRDKLQRAHLCLFLAR